VTKVLVVKGKVGVILSENADETTIKNLARFGFRFEKGNTHAARSMMFKELQELFSFLKNSGASKSDYYKAIVEENCLSKRSLESRKITNMHLGFLYGLDPSLTIFRALRFFWERDVDGRPLLALLCSYSRDGLVRLSAPIFLAYGEGDIFNREKFEDYINRSEPGRFRETSLKATVRNLCTTWTRSGHFVGYSDKIRSKAVATPGSVSYSLFLGYLIGLRGEALFSSEFSKLLDCSMARAIELADIASSRDWINFKRIGKVMEVQFPRLLTTQENDWIHEQN
jgi:hypothetical protein